ncbi:hypothetical protein [Mesonia sp. K7]|nr:hypothetical protein [Mesonia sp. K7]
MTTNLNHENLMINEVSYKFQRKSNNLMEWMSKVIKSDYYHTLQGNAQQ